MKALIRVIMLSALSALCVIALGIQYRVAARSLASFNQWIVTNKTTWTIYVRDAETGDQLPIPPDETMSLARGSDSLKVNSMGDHFVFKSASQHVTILELFKGQLTLRPDDFVCCDEPDEHGHTQCSFCNISE